MRRRCIKRLPPAQPHLLIRVVDHSAGAPLHQQLHQLQVPAAASGVQQRPLVLVLAAQQRRQLVGGQALKVGQVAAAGGLHGALHAACGRLQEGARRGGVEKREGRQAAAAVRQLAQSAVIDRPKSRAAMRRTCCCSGRCAADLSCGGGATAEGN